MTSAGPDRIASSRRQDRRGRLLLAATVRLLLISLATKAHRIDMGGVKPGTTDEDAINQMKYDGRDDDSRPVGITAVSATHANGDDRHISLKKPLSDVIEGQNGDGELIAQGFRVLDDGDTIEFTGKAHMKIYPKQKNQERQGG